MEVRTEGRSGRMVMGRVLVVLHWEVLEKQFLVDGSCSDPHCPFSG